MASSKHTGADDDLQLPLESDEHPSGELTVTVPETATDAEAAAIVAAIGAHISDLERVAAARAERDTDAEETWNGNRWSFAGRMPEENGWNGRNGRIPTAVPTDPWTAAGRINQF